MTPEEMAVKVTDAVTLLRTEIDDTVFCPRNTVQVERTLLMVACKTLRLAEAVCSLVRNGFYGEAFGLSRSCLEAFLIVKFIANTAKDPEGRANDYLSHAEKHMQTQEWIRQKHFPHVEPPEGTPIAVTKPDTSAWQPAWNLAMDKFEHPRETTVSGVPFQAEDDYYGVYEHTSHYVHVTAVSLAPYLVRGGEMFKRPTCDSEDTKGLRALHCALGYLYMVCIILGYQFDVSLPDHVQRHVNAVLDESLANMQQNYGIFAKKKIVSAPPIVP